MEELGKRPVWSMSGGEMLAALDQVEADLARRATYRLQLIAGLDGIGHAQEIGAHDTAQLLAFRYRLDPPRARRDLRLAVALPKYADVSAALPGTDQAMALADVSENPAQADDSAEPGDEATAAEGFLRPAQAEAIVSALERVPSTVPVEDIVVAEQQLVNLARHLSPGELRRAGQRIRDILDTDGPEPDERKAYDRESLTLSAADRGVKFRGYLANENAELLRSLIHAGARPHKTIDGELDPRPREKRQADALTTVLTLAAKATDITAPTAKPTPAPAPAADTGTTATAGADTTATATPGTTATATSGSASAMSPGATVTPAPATGATGASAANATTPGGPATPAGPPANGRRPRVSDQVPGHGAKATITVTIDLQDLKSAAADATGNLVYGDGLSAAAIRRLACDAKIIPLVLGTNSEPLDVGRSERLVTRAMRRALNTRDKGCVVCGAPPIQCDAHHLRSWLDGGDTAISNLVLLCRRHHLDLHAGDWTITITNGTVHVARPTWADPPRRRTTRTPAATPPQTSATAPPSLPRAPAATLPSPSTAGDRPREEAATTSVVTHAANANSTSKTGPSADSTATPAFRSNPGAGQASHANLGAAPASRSNPDAAPAVPRLEGSAGSPSVGADPWGDNAERPERVVGRADQSALEEAARFAVWGEAPSRPRPAPAVT